MKIKGALTMVLTIAMSLIFTACGNVFMSDATQHIDYCGEDGDFFMSEENDSGDVLTEEFITDDTPVDITEEVTEEDTVNDLLAEEFWLDDFSDEEDSQTDTQREMVSLRDFMPEATFNEVVDLQIPIGFWVVDGQEVLSQKYTIVENTVFLFDGTYDIVIKYDENISVSDDLSTVDELSTRMMLALDEINQDMCYINARSFVNEKGKAVGIFGVTYKDLNATYFVAVIQNHALLVNVNSSESDLDHVYSIAWNIASSLGG